MPELVNVGEGREEMDQMVFDGSGGREHEVYVLKTLDAGDSCNCWLDLQRQADQSLSFAGGLEIATGQRSPD